MAVFSFFFIFFAFFPYYLINCIFSSFFILSKREREREMFALFNLVYNNFTCVSCDDHFIYSIISICSCIITTIVVIIIIINFCCLDDLSELIVFSHLIIFLHKTKKNIYILGFKTSTVFGEWISEWRWVSEWMRVKMPTNVKQNKGKNFCFAYLSFSFSFFFFCFILSYWFLNHWINFVYYLCICVCVCV